MSRVTKTSRLPAAPRRKAYHHGNLRPALVDAATALLRAEGPLGVTLRGAARRAGVSQAAPYRHFHDKEALLAAVAENGFRALAAATARAIEPHAEDPIRALRALAAAYLRYATDEPAHYRLMYAPTIRGRHHPPLRQAAESAWEHFTSLIRAGQRARLLRTGEPATLAFVLWSLLHGLAMLLVDRQLPPRVTSVPVELLGDYATQTLLDGFGLPPRSRVRRRRPG
jgi:AcrR family transcriptional regulator